MNLRQVFEELQRQAGLSCSEDYQRGAMLAIDLLRPLVEAMPKAGGVLKNEPCDHCGRRTCQINVKRGNHWDYVGEVECGFFEFDYAATGPYSPGELRAIADKLDELKEEV